MKPVILACGNLVHYVMTVQQKCGAHCPVVALNIRLHVDPPKMREAAVDALDRRTSQRPGYGACGSGLLRRRLGGDRRPAENRYPAF